MIKNCLLLLASAFLLSCNKQNVPENGISFSDMEESFKNVPDSTKLAVYWYWMSNNISKDGVVKDLHSMKEVGINRVFIGNIAQDNVSYGDIEVFSDQWWEILHTALKTATELDIEVGIFNSPGWSQSGGPWVKQEESMRYLASSSVVVNGKGKKTIQLPEIKDGQDVKLLAYPVIPEVKKSWNVDKKPGKSIELKMVAPDENMRSLIFTTQSHLKTNATLYAKVDGNYKLVKSFELNRSNPRLVVGFDPYAPIIISLPDLNTKEYKLVIDKPGKAVGTVTLTSKPYIERYPEKTLAKMFQTPLPMWDDYLWERQEEVDSKYVLSSNDVIDLTELLGVGNTITWDVPEGDWNMVRYAMKTTGVTNAPASPEATGLEIDKMSKKHIRTHFDAFLGEILRRIPQEDRKTFKVAVMDSYETGGMNWTDDMEKRFVDTYGYSPITYLPVLRGEVVGSKDLSDRFLWDLRRLIADRVSYDYVGGLKEVCHENGLTTWLENYGHWGFPGEFLQYGGQSDEVAGEYWSEGSLGDIENKAASSCAHIYGKRKVWAESFTAGGKAFARYPYLMKQRGDRFFTEGINSTLLHLYIQQPYEDKYPGVNAGFGNEFNRHNTWFSQLDVFIDYLKRCTMMLQQGQYVADVAYFIGEDAPKMTGVTDPALPYGYSFDYINAETIKKASVQDGYLTLESGMKYRILVLPKLDNMRPELLEKLNSLVNDGLIIFGPKPVKSPSLQNYPEADAVVKSLSDKMWIADNAGSCKVGKGLVYNENYEFSKLLLENEIYPDFSVSNNAPVLFIHREHAGGDIYFISNKTEKKIKFDAGFRVTGYQPELWNPLTGEIRYLTDFKDDGEKITIPMELEAIESSFIIFRDKDKGIKKQSNYPEPVLVQNVEGEWNVNFSQPAFGYDTLLVMNELKDWTAYNDLSIKYFSGTATYNIKFNVDRAVNDVAYIDLGKVMVMAKVYLNGQYAGGVWTPPYRVPVTGLLKEGTNELKVVVVNNWVNRLIGDLNLPKEERVTWTNVIPWKKDSPLQSSGLMGPVKVITLPYSETVK